MYSRYCGKLPEKFGQGRAKKFGQGRAKIKLNALEELFGLLCRQVLWAGNLKGGRIMRRLL